VPTWVATWEQHCSTIDKTEEPTKQTHAQISTHMTDDSTSSDLCISLYITGGVLSGVTGNRTVHGISISPEQWISLP